MHKRDTPMCHKCEFEQGDFIHMVWSCKRLFWTDVTAFISVDFDLSNICSPKWCRLGVFDDIEITGRAKQFL